MGLSKTQKAFATSREPYPCFCGGFGSGKTAAGIARAMALKSHYRQQDIAYYLPSYPLVEDIALKRFPELCERKGYAFKLRGGTSPHIEFPGAGRIIFRSMGNPASIVGYEVAHSICDELDTLPKDKARDAWMKVIARNRQKMPDGSANTVAVTTTPEGFRFVYEQWEKNPKPGYVLYRARTQDNAANLPDGYIENLQNSYSSAEIAAYCDGQFVNLTQGSVYPDFDRRALATREKIKPSEALHIGIDFNVGQMSAAVAVLRNDEPHFVAEHTGVFDTPAMADLLKARYPGHAIYVYPDASGNSRKSVNAQESDIAILRRAGFKVRVNHSNPPVKDRVAAVNKLIREGRLLVNPDACPDLCEALEQQAYDKHGEPDKSSGHDHIVDAGGYLIAYRYPVRARPKATKDFRI